MSTIQDTGLTVSRLAAAVGVGGDTVRYYEREGLLPAAPRTSSGYRIFTPETVERMHFIRGAQRLGLSLSDVRDLLAVRDTGVCPCEPAEQHLTRRLAEVDEQLAALSRLREQMAAMLTSITTGDCDQPEPGTWCPPGTGDTQEGGGCG